ncbi:hypothetical protein KUL42_09890 [Alteromonas sp. KUL42]|uniref:hypothetical protein n=1 Tax=Alteromonas sp. KUL42 TaxID=2480797 RepID=UPI001035CEC2|nr:hypothetical protein [Alteromonas sp. KUL42]TAP37778.1 hypothetical protein EYR97_04915 [Alteromonas sp. KUL42]GEA06228.1 hypothetical protein KUL42_09890 [Alteromonas sp. KUL42]
MSIPIFPRYILPSSLQFKIIPNSMVNSSPGRVSEVWTRPGAYWVFSGTWSRIRYADGRVLSNFIDALDGSAGEFMMWDSTHTQLGSWAGTIVTDGTNQSGTVLSIRGAVPNTLIAPAGDRFQLDNYLYKLVEDAVADQNGECTLRIRPQLFTVPTDGTGLVVNDPMNKMMLPDNQQGLSFANRKLVIQDFGINGFTSIRP